MFMFVNQMRQTNSNPQEIKRAFKVLKQRKARQGRALFKTVTSCTTLIT